MTAVAAADAWSPSAAGSVFAGPAHGGPAWAPAAGAAFGLLLAAACAWDLRTRRIPNALVAAIAAAGIAYAASTAPVLSGLGAGLAGLAVGFTLWVPFYAVRALGAGDVKFFAAASAWLGAGVALRAAVLAALAGGVLAFVWLALFGGWRRAVTHVALQAAHPTLRLPAPAPERAKTLPYGVAMALGLAGAAWFPHVLW